MRTVALHLSKVCVIVKNEKSNLAIVLNERTYAYTHGIYKAVCFIFFESTVIASGYSLLSFLIISRVHETAHTRSPSFAQSSIYERYTELILRSLDPSCVRTHTNIYIYMYISNLYYI